VLTITASMSQGQCQVNQFVASDGMTPYAFCPDSVVSTLKYLRPTITQVKSNYKLKLSLLTATLFQCLFQVASSCWKLFSKVTEDIHDQQLHHKDKFVKMMGLVNEQKKS